MSILILSSRESDLSQILEQSAPCRRMDFPQAEAEDLAQYSALALLCGADAGRPKVLSAALRQKVDAFVDYVLENCSGKEIVYQTVVESDGAADQTASSEIERNTPAYFPE